MNWRSSKQETVVDLTTILEYIVASETTKEAIWLNNFINDLGVVPSISKPIDILYHNECVVVETKEPRYHKSLTHILGKFHYIRKLMEDEDIIVRQVTSEDNLTDPLTKSLSHIKYDAHTRSIDIGFASDFA